METLWADLRYGARMMIKAPGFTLTAILAMTLGIGATTAVFSLINAVLLRPLPYSDPERLVYIWTPNPTVPRLPREMDPAHADYYDWLRTSYSFSALAMFVQDQFSVQRAGRATWIGGARVTGNFFQTLGSFPLIGRPIEADDDRPGHQQVAVISDSFWHSHFGGDPGILSKSLQFEPRLVSSDRRDAQVLRVSP